MKLLQKAVPVSLLALFLTILPLSAFADGGLDFLASVSYPLAKYSHLFLLLGYGMWIYLQDTKCQHHLVLYTLLGFLLGIFLGGIVPTMIFGISIMYLLLVLMGIMIVTQLKLNHIAGIVLSIIVGFFVAAGITSISLSLYGILSLIGLLAGVFLGLAMGCGVHCLLKDFYKGKLILAIGIIIGLVGLLKLFMIM